MIKTIIFDLDDTLYKELDFVHGAFKEVCIYLSEQYDKDFKQLYKETLDIFSNYGRGRVFNILCERYKIKEDINCLIKIYREAKPNLKLFEDAEYILGEGLELLYNHSSQLFSSNKEKKFNTGIITDGKASVQWNKVKALDLESRVDKIIVTDDYGREFWKPNEFSYREMINYFNCSPKECIYVGDNPNKDFIGARKVGLHTVRIIREYGDFMNVFLDKDYEADFKISDLRKLREIIGELAL